jgi:hypothetical protein
MEGTNAHRHEGAEGDALHIYFVLPCLNASVPI